MFANIINEQTKEVQIVAGQKMISITGATEMEVEQAYNGKWYVKGYAPEEPKEEAVKKQIVALEEQITDRNLRSAILGDEFALNKITEIENQITELRKQLGVQK